MIFHPKQAILAVRRKIISILYITDNQYDFLSVDMIFRLGNMIFRLKDMTLRLRACAGGFLFVFLRDEKQ